MDERTRYRTVTVLGQEIFYREAGDPEAPILLLLHGYPTSSHMFRDLIPRLATRYRLVAPDHLGFGHSATPSVDDFDYTFANLAEITAAFTERLGLSRFAMYVQDYGAPIGWRLATAHPERVTAIVTQNGNAYLDGLDEDFWAPIQAYGTDPSPDTEAAVRQALTLDAIRWQYTHGVPDESLVSPDTWRHDFALLQRPGNAEIQLRLFRDYITNIDLYPAFQEYFRASRVPLLAAWGAHDEIFRPGGATAFQRDLPDAEIHLLPAGHFALESHGAQIARLVDDFLGRVLPR
ncbi:alpha/beta hydrolase [Streptosporangium oxazolinicum]|uniref:Alpha/beta hydrolase n=1 Tax=Streptosporangium oxazolinicum TaxID=909287 RepID=A0ABP8B5G6_9ACTN